jgi:hypothetical protein
MPDPQEVPDYELDGIGPSSLADKQLDGHGLDNPGFEKDKGNSSRSSSPATIDVTNSDQLNHKENILSFSF